jgi:hypothetical protein
MNEKLKGIAVGVCTLVELGCIGALAYIGLKRNQDAYEARMECIDLSFKNLALDVENHSLKCEIKKLKEE